MIELLFVILSGLAFGSLVTLLSYRIPRGEDVVIKPSRCPKCEVPLKVVDLFPVLSWIASKARCRYCQAPISLRYPMTELIVAGVFFLLYTKFGVSAMSITLALMWVALMVMILVDLEHYIIPDTVQIALVVLGISYHLILQTPFLTVVGGAAFGAFIALSLRFGYRMIRKKEGLGIGDVKFFTVAGLWLGITPMVPFLFFAGLFGIVTGLVWKKLGRGEIFPFGPALALSLYLSVVYPEITGLFWNIGHIAK